MRRAKAPAARAGRRAQPGVPADASAGAPETTELDPQGPPASHPRGSQNHHLHLALLGALVVACAIAFAVPISREPAHGEASAPPPPVEGLISALRSHAGSVAAVVASPESASSDEAALADALPGAGLIPSRLLAAAGDAAGGITFFPEGSGASVLLPYASPISFTVHGEGLAVRHTTSEATVGQALAAAGIRIGRNDTVTPGVDARLTQGMHIYIWHARIVRLIFENSERLVYTRAATVGALLGELGIEPHPTDRIFPALGSPVRKGMSISFVTFRDGSEFTEDPIAYRTIYEQDMNMLEGEHRVVQAGIEGFVRREYRITRLNGQELGREMVGEMTVPATDEVIAVGTRPRATPAPRAPVVSFEGMTCVRTLNVYATWYTAASAGGSGITATGTAVYKGIVAVDPAVIPLGTRMWIPGYGYGLAADTGGAVKGNFIDLGYGDGDVKDWRSRHIDICILG